MGSGGRWWLGWMHPEEGGGFNGEEQREAKKKGDKKK
jgi:hypothetical protein